VDRNGFKFERVSAFIARRVSSRNSTEGAVKQLQFRGLESLRAQVGAGRGEQNG
jgi:hypothetical protein